MEKWKKQWKKVSSGSIGRIDLLFQNINGPTNILVLFDVVVNLFDSMHDGGMVSFAERIPDGAERKVCHIAAQIHRNVSGLHNFGISLGASDILRGNIKMLCYGCNDQVRGDLSLSVRRDEFLQSILRKLQCDLAVFDPAERNQL